MKFEEMKKMPESYQLELYNRLNSIRHNYKTAGYAHQYGAGAPRVAATLDISQTEAKQMHSAYWKRNWAVKAVAKDSKIKTIRGQMWLLNPLNGFYYSLRSRKDIFSVLCQGGGTYIFDIWIYNMRAKDVIASMQYHDEVLVYAKKLEGERNRIKNILKSSVEKVNKQLGLLREMDVDVHFGDNYAEVH